MSRLVIFFLVLVTLGLSLLLAFLGLATVHSNLLGWFLLISGLIYFFGVIVVYWVRGIRFWRPKAGGEAVKEERNDWSFWFIVVGMIATFYLPPIEFSFSPALIPRTVWIQIAGLFIIFLGSILFIWARRVLGKFYSGHVSVIEGQQLVQIGPYRLIRHPAYAGYILISIGLALGYSSLAGFVSILSLLLPSVIYRIHIEEHLLAEHFGEQWIEYCQRVPAFFPRLVR